MLLMLAWALMVPLGEGGGSMDRQTVVKAHIIRCIALSSARAEGFAKELDLLI